MGGFGQATPVQGPRRRGVGRPSVVTQYGGYRGGKSALYELVRRVSAEDSLGPGSIGGQASMILRESQDPNTSADRLNSAQAP